MEGDGDRVTTLPFTYGIDRKNNGGGRDKDTRGREETHTTHNWKGTERNKMDCHKGGREEKRFLATMKRKEKEERQPSSTKKRKGDKQGGGREERNNQPSFPMRLTSFCIGWGWRHLYSNYTVAMVVLFVLLWCPCALHVSFHFFALCPSFVLLPHASFAKYLISCYALLLPLLEHVSSSPLSTPLSTPPSNRRLSFRHVFLPSSSFLLSCRHSIGVSFAPCLFHHRSLGWVHFLLPPSNPQAIETMVLSNRYQCVPPVFFPSRSDRSRS